MNLRCLVGLHSPMLNSIVRREDRFAALCDRCCAPLERRENGRWKMPDPLVSRRNQAV